MNKLEQSLSPNGPYISYVSNAFIVFLVFILFLPNFFPSLSVKVVAIHVTNLVYVHKSQLTEKMIKVNIVE